MELTSNPGRGCCVAIYFPLHRGRFFKGHPLNGARLFVKGAMRLQAQVDISGWKPIDAPISVAIVEDQKETREGLSFLINGAERFECLVMLIPDGSSAGVELEPRPNVALVDIGLPGSQRHRGRPYYAHPVLLRSRLFC